MNTMVRTSLLTSDLTTSGATRGAAGRTGVSPSSGVGSVLFWIDASGSSGLPFPSLQQASITDPVSDRITDLKTRSCLTWPQVARLFGVSKRAVMLWQAGGQMSAVHEERLTELLSRLHQAPTDDPIDTRVWLMAIDGLGTAPYQRWVEEATSRKRDPWVDRQPTLR
jgi:hypothetical protein